MKELELFEVIDEIEDKIEFRIKDYHFEPALENIIIGSKSKISTTRPPAVWVFFDESPIEVVSGKAEEWGLNFILVGTYKSNDLREAKTLSQKIVIQASKAVMEGRNLDLPEYVRDVIRTNYLPGTSRMNDNDDTIHGSGITMRANFRFIP